jgi:hypothetical protein
MSHTLTMSNVKLDVEAVKQAAQALKIRAEEGQHRFYDGSVASGLVVHLEGWQHPLVIKADGTMVYDNYHGSWGRIEKLNDLTAYSLAAMADYDLGTAECTLLPETGERLYSFS